MHPKSVLKYTTSANRSLFALNATMLLSVLLGLSFSIRYIENYANGPFIVDADELESLTAQKEPRKYFLSVSGADAVDTGYQYVTSSRNKYTNATTETGRSSFYVLLTANRVRDALLIKAPSEQKATTYTGFLEAIPEDLRNSLMRELKLSPEAFDAQFHPFMLTADRDFRLLGHLSFGLAFLMSGLAIWNLSKCSIRWKSPLNHPGCKSFHQHGAIEDVVKRIDLELSGGAKYFGQIHLTESWLISSYFYKLSFVSLQDCDWIYLKTTQHSVWFIPTVKVFAVIVKARDGSEIEAAMKEPQAGELLKELAAKAPWAIFGFSEKLEAVWKNERHAFHAAVDERKVAWLKTQG